jgi:hypothetical protein
MRIRPASEPCGSADTHGSSGFCRPSVGWSRVVELKLALMRDHRAAAMHR